jgi:hypothetical protein
MKAIVIILLVVGVLVGGILTLRSTRNVGVPGKDVLDRAKERSRAQATEDDEKS